MKNVTSDQILQGWKHFIATGTINHSFIRKEIAESWQRSLFENKLDPYEPKQPLRLSQQELANIRQKNTVLIEAAKPFLQVLAAAVQNSGFILTFADRDCYLLEVFGDEEILKLAAVTNYLPGCRRTEGDVGTNAIGLSLYEKKPIQVTGPEHFNFNNHGWTCSTSPIFSFEKEILGFVTLSGKSVGVHKHNLGMVIAAAKAIENKIGEEKLSQEKNRLNSYLDLILDSISEGLIAIERNGKVTHINRIAEKMLDISKEVIEEKLLNTIVGIDPAIWQKIIGDPHLIDQEIIVDVSGKPNFFFLSTKPVEVDRKVIGKILILTEKQRVCELIQKFTGGQARFTFDDIIGKDQQLLRQVELARIASKADSRILLVGESGTGKELFAQAIHNASKRKNGPFVAVSCAAIPRELIEAELFGYIEGAFTGSRKGGQIGKFELANKGSIFLDEIGSMPYDMQAKILRVLQENEIVRLGDSKPRKVDVLVIAATNRDLMEEVQNKNFREDLYFRLNVVEIIIPPLKERMKDLPWLIQHILRRIGPQLKKDSLTVSQEALQILKSYSWPGNVRELQNYLERASILCDDRVIKPEHLPNRLLTYSTFPQQISDELKTLKEQEEMLIVRALTECQGNISESARRLQISRSTLHRRVKILGLSSHRFYQ